ncbi:MAG: CHASE2 domain-containing protein [Treponema sp.]|nr:CHASE2 domain-containing protein [Treponema sp.]
MEKKKKNAFSGKSLARIVVILIIIFWTGLSVTGLLQKFDYRLYDLLLGLRKSPAEQKELLFVEADNDSLEALGPWPWTRDIMANALLRIKELGAKEAVFDIEYLSPSNLGVNPDAAETLDKAFEEQKEEVSGVISELASAVNSGRKKAKDLPSLSQEMIADYVNPGFDTLYDIVQANVYRDYDDMLARSLQFFGNSWLTINISDIGINPSEEEVAYASKRILLKNVTDKNDLTAKDDSFYCVDQGNAAGFAPAMHRFLSSAQGAGFTNIVLDKDGTRRRVILLSKYKDGEYAGQLVFAPLLKKFDVQQVIRHRNSIELVGMKLPGSSGRKNIRIPVDEHGRMYINWQHKEFVNSFRHSSILWLAQLDDMERNIVNALKALYVYHLPAADGGNLSFTDAVESLLRDYNDIKEYKEYLLSHCLGYDDDGNAVEGGISDEEYAEYFGLREAFFDNVNSFGTGSFEEEIMNRLVELQDEIGEARYTDNVEGVTGVFDTIKSEGALYTSYMEEMGKDYKDSFCIIGNTASSTTDLGSTPFNRAYPNVGTHANVYNTIVTQDFIVPVSGIFGTVFAIVLALLYVFMSENKKAWQQNTIGALLVAMLLLIPVLLMMFFGIYTPVVTPALIAISSFLAVTILRFITSEKDKSFLRNAFSTYLSPTVVDQLVKSPDKLRLGGEEKEMTALFTDIRSFSTFSEKVTPTKLVRVLNEYLGAMSDCILAQDGTIDKYIGDAIVSFFGAPLDLPDHAYAASVAAIRMKQAEKRYNDEHFASGDIPMLLQTRIGLNTGSMVVGNMGTSNKMNYTMMGDNVNLAARLEGVNKVYHSWILASETTWNMVDSGSHAGELIARPFDRVRVVGKEQPVQLYNILGFKSELSSVELEMTEVFKGAIDAYLKRDFKKAEQIFMEANKVMPDETSIMFAERCREYMSANLPDDWDGVYQMTTKGHD